MSNIIELHEQLPDNLKDLSAFVLVGREKLTAVRAEIRAIQKLELAEEVRQQKMDEARMLSEALLDAEVRIGELTKRIPKTPRIENIRSNSGVTSEEKAASNSSVTSQNEQPQTKEQAIADMGFSKMQISRFEALADNKDLVEQVKAEARENNTIPTRGKVLELARERKEDRNPAYAKIDSDYKISMSYHDAIYKPLLLKVDENSFRIWREDAMDKTTNGVNMQIWDIDRAIEKLLRIKQMLIDSQKIRIVGDERK